MLRRSWTSTSPIVGLIVVIFLFTQEAPAQVVSSLSEASLRPFVVGVVPVVGRGGAVGGVAIDADGVIQQAHEHDIAMLRSARQTALNGVTGEVARPSELRKISLRRLDMLLASYARQKKQLPPEVLYVAGVQRIEFVFVFPEQHDVVLAGPAEGWKVDEAGNVVGSSTGAAAMQLDDLIAALRTSPKLLAGEMISCSIDPTPEGLQRFAQLMHGGRTSPSSELLAEMEEAVGPHAITITGVPAQSHFAHILVAADWQMKRLAMGLAASPVPELVSYLEMLKHNPGATPRSALPRWWIAFGRRPVERDADGLAWRLSPPGLEVRTAAARLDVGGRLAGQSENDRIAQQWADAMTTRYEQLSSAEPIFGQLRGCMDLALVAAVLTSSDLLAHVGLELPMLLDERHLQLTPNPVPKTVASQASAVRRSRGWVVSVSGGVDFDVADPVNKAVVQANVGEARRQAAPQHGESWWWD